MADITLPSSREFDPLLTARPFPDEDEKAKSEGRVKRIYFDNNKPEDCPIYRFRQLIKGGSAVPCRHIADMAEDFRKFDRHCDVVVVSGHGAPSHQGLGSSTCGDYSKGQDFCYDELGDIEKELSVVQEYMQPQKGRPSPVLFLSGCDVGKDLIVTKPKKKNRGPVLLKQLSKRLEDVAIIASADRMSVEKVKNSETPAVFFQKVANKKLSKEPVDLVCALNGRVIVVDVLDTRRDQFSAFTGHKDTSEMIADLLYHEAGE